MSYRYPPIDSTVVIKDAHVVEGGQTKIRTQNSDLQGQLNDALIELRIANIQLGIMTDTQVEKTEVT